MTASNRRINSKGLQRIVVLLLSLSFWPALSLMPTTLNPPKSQGCDEKTSESNAASSVYKIVGIPSGPQYLPASYVKTFSRWTIEETGSGGSYKLVPIDDTPAECSAKQQETTDKISIQPTINFLIQGGVPVYVFVGLVVISSETSKDTQPKRHLSLAKEDLHNNFLAQQWTTFDKTAHPNFHIQVFWGGGDGTDGDQSVGIVDPPTVQTAVEKLGYALSTTENNDLSSGFHIVTLALPMDMSSSSSSPNFQQQQSTKDAAILLTCLALTEPNAREILKLDDSTAAISKLQVDAAKVLSTA